MAVQDQGPLLKLCFDSHLPPLETQERFIQDLWPRPPTAAQTSESIEEWDAFFSYVQSECDPAVRQRYCLTTYKDIIFVVNMLGNYPEATFTEIRTSIERTRPQMAQQSLPVSMELAVRLWLMMNVRNVMPVDSHQLRTSIPWPENSSLKHVLQNHFRGRTTTPKGKFSKYLNFYDMKAIGGIHIEWTNNLALHLTMKGTSLHVFHCVSVLKRIRQSPTVTSLLPHDMIDETLATIDLLAPLTTSNCNSWLADEIKRWRLDQNLMHRDPPQLDRIRYSIWLGNLQQIEEAFEATKPRSFIQWWHDRRDMQQWWGFWLVVSGIFLTVLFGLIQSITGILQVTRPSS